MEATETLRAQLESLLKLIVHKPDELRVEAVIGDDSFELKVYVDDTDVGRVLGARGTTIHALRVVWDKMVGKLIQEGRAHWIRFDIDLPQAPNRRRPQY